MMIEHTAILADNSISCSDLKETQSASLDYQESGRYL